MKYFVFVVCGAKKHIETLNFSLCFLRYFSNYPIMVITDSCRNDIPIVHDKIVDIKTPDEFDHHQASIFLKTGLHHFVPDIENDTYCYLDSDVVALSECCNSIFDFDPDPILFASDHCAFNEFSPYAMNCNCHGDFDRKKNEFVSAFKAYFPDYMPANEDVIESHNHLNELFALLKHKPLKNSLININYLLDRYLSPQKNIFLENFRFNKKNRCWYDEHGNMVSFDYRYHKSRLWKQQQIRFENDNWFNKNNENITPQTPYCNHLCEHIRSKFGISIPSIWRHWNGGVFLFNKKSVDFMEYWHTITLEEFEDAATKTRDQGTLAVTAWKFKLENIKTLPVEFNFIAEYGNPDIRWSREKGYTNNGYRSSFTPAMLHIYHHWNDIDWDLWQSLTNLAAKNSISVCY
jgi:hypothetical protein